MQYAKAMRRWVMRPVHISWRLAVVCSGFIIGVWLVLYTQQLGHGAAILLLAALFCRPRWVLVLTFIAAVSLGNWYGTTTRVQQSVARGLYGKVAVITGVVKEDPSTTARGTLTVQLQNVEVSGQPLAGVFWAGIPQQPVLRGDTVTVKGNVDAGFGTFIGMIKQAQVVAIQRPVPGDVGRVVRDWFANAIRNGIPEPQASLGIGFLTGQKSALPLDLAEALRIAGLSHIVVASGYNLTILVRLARRLFVKHSKYASVLSASLMIGGFVSMTGLSPSMTRAGLVSGLSLLTWAYGRSCHPFVLLPLVAAVTVLWQPSYVWGDMGWQLSFAAFFGVMVVAPLLQAYFFGHKPPGAVRQVLGETVAASIVTVPILVSGFGVLSVVSIPANLLIVPLVPLAMLLTFITGCVGLGAPMIASLVGAPATWLLMYMTSVSRFLADLPWAQQAWQPPGWVWFVYCAILALALYGMKRATRIQLRDANPVI